MSKKEFIKLLEEYLENGSGILESYFNHHLNAIETKGMGKVCLVAILWCVPFCIDNSFYIN